MVKPAALTQYGFTLIELVATLVLISVLSAVILSRSFSNDTFTLMASRDRVVAAFLLAQQQAMAQSRAIQFSTNNGQLDIRRDDNADTIFSSTESIYAEGQQYPLSLASNLSISGVDFVFDRRGQTSAANINLSQGSASVQLQVSAAGHIQ